MDQTIVLIIAAAGAFIIGLIAGKFIFAKNTQKQIDEANLQAQTILKEAELRAETLKKENSWKQKSALCS